MSGTEVSLALVTRGGHPDFLALPWAEPLAEWEHPRIVSMARGVSRHVVRFVAYDDRVYALKETSVGLAQREFRTLRSLARDHLPVVEAVGVVTDRTARDGSELGAVLITRFLDYALPYRYVFALGAGLDLRPRLLDAGALLLVRLHLEGVFWGDCSLSNVLFRRDAGALMAYLVDAETVERTPPPLDDGLRGHDLDLAVENLAGGLYDLQAAGRLPPEIDPVIIVEDLRVRYDALWAELTRTDEVPVHEHHVVEERVRRLQELGFDVEELVLVTTAGGEALRIRPVVVEEGHHHRELRRRTGLEVQENQARRLLSDICAYRAWLERSLGDPVSDTVAAARWLSEVYEPVTEAIPEDLRGRLEVPELFHELLEHRWLLSERTGREVSTAEALESYLRELEARPDERALAADVTFALEDELERGELS